MIASEGTAVITGEGQKSRCSLKFLSDLDNVSDPKSIFSVGISFNFSKSSANFFLK